MKLDLGVIVAPNFQSLHSCIPNSSERIEREYLLRITRSGSSAEPFGWQILREQDSSEIASSAKTFATRIEALADSARIAAPLALDAGIDRELSGSC